MDTPTAITGPALPFRRTGVVCGRNGAERLSELSVRYVAEKAEAAAEFAKRRPTEPGSGPNQDGSASGRRKRDARAVAASRLGAGVSHTTSEKVAWLQRAAEDRERPFPVRRAAFDALEEIDAGGPVDWVYTKVHASALIAELEDIAEDEAAHPVVRVLAQTGAEYARKAEAGHLPPAKVDAAARRGMRPVQRTRRATH
jgi:uncharacterized protein (UPF0147 family)